MSSNAFQDLKLLTTEQRNPSTMKMDQMTTIQALKVINAEDKKVAFAVEEVLPSVEAAVELVHQAFLNGGRLFYVGAGTSGRLAILDASECVPTFMTSPDQVQAIMAGGAQAFIQAAEGTEDDEDQGAQDLKARNLTEKDVVIGITASGRTPYPIGSLKFAGQIGAGTISLSCNKNSAISGYADCPIEVIVGPEVLTGSTRMKAATAHKMILNMISTTVMMKIGKVYENLMVDVNPSNHKLVDRAKRIISEITGVSYEKAGEMLEKSNGKVKPAIVMVLADTSYENAARAIDESRGKVREAVAFAKTLG